VHGKAVVLQQPSLVQFVVGPGVISDFGVMTLLVNRVCGFPVRLCLILCSPVLLRKLRIAASLAVGEVLREHCQPIIPVFVGDIVKHLRSNWLGFRR